MIVASIVAVGVVVATGIALLPVAGRWRLGGAAAVLVVAGIVAAVWPASEPVEDVTPADRTASADDAYTSSRACRACHPDAYATWHQSYHRTMTQRATEQSVVAPWEGELESEGMTWRLLRDGERYLVDAPKIGTDGSEPDERETLPVVMTTGSHHMQLYWVPLPWASSLAAPAGRKVFETHCASCHGEEGTEGRLIEAGLTPPDLEEGLEHGAHSELELPDSERRRVLGYLERVQIRGRLQQVPFAWFIREQRWVHEEDTFLQPPEELPGHADWEQTWSEACDQCHSVGPEAEWRADGSPTQAAVAELGIACEACHGPAREHADAMRDPASRYLTRLGFMEAPDIVNPSELDAERAMAVCAQCHGELVRTEGHGTSFPVGETLSPWGHIVPYMEQGPYPDWLEDTVEDDPLLMSSAFWRDGTMRVAGRDANAMVASACFDGGMTCITCHDLHGGSRDDQLGAGMRGDAACVECHPVQAAEGSAHTHHAPESEGSRCMNCHMPHTTLGLLTAMRSHRVDSPSAMRTHTTGRPDACTLCHLDQPLTWAATHLNDWYGHEIPPIAGEDRSYAVDRLLRGDAAQRAVYAWHMGWEPALDASGRDWVPGVLAQALDDPYVAVRAIATQSLHAHPVADGVELDFTAEEAERQAIRDAVVERWLATDPPHRPEVMLDEDGLDEGLIHILQMVRDDRPVVVSE